MGDSDAARAICTPRMPGKTHAFACRLFQVITRTSIPYMTEDLIACSLKRSLWHRPAEDL